MIILDLLQKLFNNQTQSVETTAPTPVSVFDNTAVNPVTVANNQATPVVPQEQNGASVFAQQPISFITIPAAPAAPQPFPTVLSDNDNLAASMMLTQAQLEQSKTLLPDIKVPDYTDLPAPEEEKPEPNADELLQTVSFIEQEEENLESQFGNFGSFSAIDSLDGAHPDTINPDGAIDSLDGSGLNTLNPDQQVNTLPNEIFNPENQDTIPPLGSGVDPLEGGNLPEQIKPQDGETPLNPGGIDPLGGGEGSPEKILPREGELPQGGDGIDPLEGGNTPGGQIKPQDGEIPLGPGGVDGPGGGEGGSVLPGDDTSGIGGAGGGGYVTGPSGTGEDSSEIDPNGPAGVHDPDDKTTAIPYDKLVDIVNEKIDNKEIEISDPNKLIDFLKDQNDPIETIEKIQQLQEANVDIEQLIENKEEAKKVLEMPKEEIQKIVEVIKEAIKEDPELAETKVDIISIIEEIKKQDETDVDDDVKKVAHPEDVQNPKDVTYGNEIKQGTDVRPAVYTTPQGDAPYVEGLNEAAAQDALKKNEPIVKTYASNWTNINAAGNQEDTSSFSHIIQTAEEDKRVNPTRRQANNVLPEYVMTGAVDMAMAEEITPEGQRIAKKSGVKAAKIAKKESTKAQEKAVQNTTSNNYIAPIEDEEHDVQKHLSAGKRNHQEAAAAAAAADGKQMSTYLVDKNEATNTKYEGSLQNLQSRNKISTDEYRLGKIEHCNTKNAGYYLDKDIHINPNGTEMTLNQASSTLVSEYTEAHMVNGERIRNYYDKNAVLIIQENETNGTSIVKAGDNGEGYVKYDAQGNITEISPNGKNSYKVKQQNNGVYTLVEIQTSFAFPKESIKAFL